MTHRTNLHIEHPTLTFAQLRELAEGKSVERSGHVGNQNLAELALATNLPNLQIIHVDTINGTDRYADPARLHVSGKVHRLTPGSASNKIVGALPITAQRMAEISELHPALKELAGLAGAAAVHQVSIGLCPRIARPMLLSELICSGGELSAALMEQLHAQKLIRRTVDEGGTIAPFGEQASLQTTGIFGLPDETAANQGALLPLEGMLALDILRSLQAGHDTVHHLAGPDMRTYTKNVELMQPVGQAIDGTLALLGQRAVDARFVVIDITNVPAIVDPAQQHVASQYDLIVDQLEPFDRHIAIPEVNETIPLGVG